MDSIDRYWGEAIDADMRYQEEKYQTEKHIQQLRTQLKAAEEVVDAADHLVRLQLAYGSDPEDNLYNAIVAYRSKYGGDNG